VRGQDYTATSGTSIASLAALTASDVIEILTFDSFSIADGILATTVDAKGDLLVGIANDTVGRVAVGTDGYFLKANSGVTGGVEWSTVPGAFAQISEPTSPSDGTVWIDTDGTAPTTVVTRWTEQPAAGTTVLTGNDDYSIPLAYSPGYEQVFLNGVLLSRSGSEYTASNGTSITLAAATVAGDIVEVICPLQIATTDTYTQSAVNNAFVANTGYFAAGKNKILNSDFNINQRSVTSTTTNDAFIFDRWSMVGVGGTTTTTSESFTPGTAPVTGYEGNKFIKQVISGQTTQSQYAAIRQKIEDVRTFANQTVTFSFWAKADSGTPYLWVEPQQYFGTGGSPSATAVAQLGSTITISTSWARYSVTGTIASIAGKTIGTDANSSALQMLIWTSLGSSIRAYTNATFQNAGISIWGVQLEAGSNATAFQTATGTIQGELAACQRYLPAFQNGNWFNGFNNSTGRSFFTVKFPTTARTAPTGFTVPAASNFTVYNASTVSGSATAITFDSAGLESADIYLDNTAGSPTMTVGFGALMRIGASGYILFTGCEL
jgi:hypothetical protein